jgi:hypothetical protein
VQPGHSLAGTSYEAGSRAWLLAAEPAASYGGRTKHRRQRHT